MPVLGTRRWPPSASLRPAPLALLLLLAPAPAALRLSQQREAENGGSETCSMEPRELIEEDLPPGQAYLGPGISLRRDTTVDSSHIQSAMREYQTNLSHVRVCSSIKDKTTYLAPLIVPSLKLAFCYVPKVACTQFKDLFNAMNKLGLPEGFGSNYLVSTPWKLHVDRANITKAKGWKFAIFTRDPALRYLSAWGSTCVSQGPKEKFEHRFECCGPLVKDNTLPAETIVSMFEQRVQSDRIHGVVKEDDHWVSQVQILRMCGWDRFKPEHLDFHGRMSGNMNEQVKAMLKMVNAEPWMLAKADKLFPPSGVAGHHSPLRRISTEMFFRNASTIQAIKKIYEDDYEKIPQVGCSFTDFHAVKPAASSASVPAEPEQKEVKKEEGHKEGEQREDVEKKTEVNKEPQQKEVKKEEGHKEGEHREDLQKKTDVSKEPKKKEVKKEEGHKEGEHKEDMQNKTAAKKEEARRKHEEEIKGLTPEEQRKLSVERKKKRAVEQKKKQEKGKRDAQEHRKRDEAAQKKRWEEKKRKQVNLKRDAQAKWRKNHMEESSAAKK